MRTGFGIIQQGEVVIFTAIKYEEWGALMKLNGGYRYEGEMENLLIFGSEVKVLAGNANLFVIDFDGKEQGGISWSASRPGRADFHFLYSDAEHLEFLKTISPEYVEFFDILKKAYVRYEYRMEESGEKMLINFYNTALGGGRSMLIQFTNDGGFYLENIKDIKFVRNV